MEEKNGKGGENINQETRKKRMINVRKEETKRKIGRHINSRT